MKNKQPKNDWDYAEHGGECLSFQHSEGQNRQISMSVTPMRCTCRIPGQPRLTSETLSQEAEKKTGNSKKPARVRETAGQVGSQRSSSQNSLQLQTESTNNLLGEAETTHWKKFKVWPHNLSTVAKKVSHHVTEFRVAYVTGSMLKSGARHWQLSSLRTYCFLFLFCFLI